MKGYYFMPHPPIMVHEVGKGREEEIQKSIDSCEAIGREINKLDIDTIIVITPHGTVFRDAVSILNTNNIEGDLGQFGAQDISFNFKINTELTNEIINESYKKGISIVGLDYINSQSYEIDLTLDHGVMVPLYNIENVERYKLVHITYGMLSPMELYSFGMCVKRACESLDAKAVIIASGDLSHRLIEGGPYPYSPYGKKFDNELINILKEGEISKLFKMDSAMVNESGQCGLRSLYVLAGTLDGKEVKADVLSYEGPFGVGY